MHSLHSRSRPTRGPFYPGDRVFIYRRGRGSKKRAASVAGGWHGPATVIISEPADAVSPRIVWCNLHGNLYRCAPEQLRLVGPEERLTEQFVKKHDDPKDLRSPTVRNLEERLRYLRELEDRRATILKSIVQNTTKLGISIRIWNCIHITTHHQWMGTLF